MTASAVRMQCSVRFQPDLWLVRLKADTTGDGRRPMAEGLFVRVLDAGRNLIDVLQDALVDGVSVCGGGASCKVALVKERHLDEHRRLRLPVGHGRRGVGGEVDVVARDAQAV